MKNFPTADKDFANSRGKILLVVIIEASKNPKILSNCDLQTLLAFLLLDMITTCGLKSMLQPSNLIHIL